MSRLRIPARHSPGPVIRRWLAGGNRCEHRMLTGNTDIRKHDGSATPIFDRDAEKGADVSRPVHSGIHGDDPVVGTALGTLGRVLDPNGVLVGTLQPAR